MMCFTLLPESIGCDDEERLAKFLEQSNLEQLSLAHVENQYARAAEPERRLEFAEQLIERYRVVMLNPADRQQISGLIRKTRNVLRDFPQLESAQLQIAISHSTFLRCENEFFDWWQDGASINKATALNEELEQLKDDVARQRRQLDELREQLIAVLPLKIDDAASEQRRLQQVGGRIAHLDFLSGWVCYFQAAIMRLPDQSLLGQAHQHFYDSLQLEQTYTIDKVNSKWLELDGFFARRTILGLGLVYAAQSQHAASQFCMTKLKSLDPDFASEIWTLYSVAFARKWELLNELMQEVSLDEASVDVRRRYYRALAYAGFVARSEAGEQENPPVATRLQRSGLMGLLRSFDTDSIDAIAQRNKFALDQRNVEDLWIIGVKELEQAGADQKFYSQASATLKQALAQSSDLEPADRLRIEYLVAVADFNNKNVESALALLTPAVINSSDDLLAEASGWLRARILIQQSRGQPSKIAAALAALNSFESKFPKSRYSERIQFERCLLESKLVTPQRAIALLAGIDAGSEHYPQAVFEIAVNRFKLWQIGNRSNSTDEPLCFERLEEAVDKAIDVRWADTAQKTSALFYLVEASLQRNDSFKSTAEILKRYESIIANDAAVENKTIGEYRFYEFRLAKLAKDFLRADEIAKAIDGIATNSRHRVVCLGYLAQRSEDKAMPPNEKIAIYQRLVRELGIEPETLQSHRNSRVAANRLVELLIEAEQFDRARKINASLVASAPNRLPYLLNAARIASGAGDADEALGNWRRLVKGTKVGEPVWNEAKYSIARIHADDNVESARQIIQQTMAIAGELPEAWRVKFDELLRQINSKSDRD